MRTDLIHHSQTGVFSLRAGDWKAIFETEGSGGWAPPAGTPPEPLAPGQLYNMREDPGETRNLWDERPDVRGELATRLVQYRQAGCTVQRDGPA